MTLLKYVQVVVSNWISIAVLDGDKPGPPGLTATSAHRPEWKSLRGTWRLCMEGVEAWFCTESTNYVASPTQNGCYLF